MSAHIVSHATINALISWACRHGVEQRGAYSHGEEQDAGALLFAANVESVNYRYPQGERETADGYVFEHDTTERQPVEIIKLCQYVAYQSNERPDWDGSQAFSLLARIRDRATGGEIFPIGPSDTVYAEDGNTVVDFVGPWTFLRGKGVTFLDAVEDQMRQARQDTPTPHS